ncbi:type II secretion system F family protein [Gorillibacterium massiliense]|uniref:type II secretion system F family protein n=1 Tax=Gorillibacterium massiliense TaxID=1280390 RepID=UPI0004AC84E3|nr:type II secretion system F family protein [Gorillibacterium massiliense]
MMVLAIALACGLMVWLAIRLLEGRVKRAGHDAEGSSSIADGRNPAFPVQGKAALQVVRYNEYRFNLLEYVFTLALAGGGLFCIGMLFYSNTVVALLLTPLAFVYPRFRRKTKIKARKDELTSQFKQLLFSLSSLLSAGHSVENAFHTAIGDLQLLYPDPDTAILRELERINGKLENGESIELALADFAERADVEDIRSFTDVFVTCKRTGGNLVEAVRRTASVLTEKIEVKQEIAVLTAQKKFESRVMSVAPLVVLAFLRYSSPDYMEPLYGNMRGAAVMTGSMAVLVLCFWVSGRILKLEV